MRRCIRRPSTRSTSRAAKRLNDVNVEGTKTVLGVAEKLEPRSRRVRLEFRGVLPATRDRRAGLACSGSARAVLRLQGEVRAGGSRVSGARRPCRLLVSERSIGPLDPHFGESAQTVANILKRLVPVSPKGGLSIVDVRDVAKAQAAMFEPGRGARRYMLSGTNVSFSSLIDILQEVTGRRVPHVAAPAWAVRPAVRAVAALQHVSPFRLPLSNEGSDGSLGPRGDDSVPWPRLRLGRFARPSRTRSPGCSPPASSRPNRRAGWQEPSSRDHRFRETADRE